MGVMKQQQESLNRIAVETAEALRITEEAYAAGNTHRFGVYRDVPSKLLDPHTGRPTVDRELVGVLMPLMIARRLRSLVVALDLPGMQRRVEAAIGSAPTTKTRVLIIPEQITERSVAGLEALLVAVDRAKRQVEEALEQERNEVRPAPFEEGAPHPGATIVPFGSAPGRGAAVVVQGQETTPQ